MRHVAPLHLPPPMRSVSVAPPLPPPPIEYIRFEGSASGMHTVGFDRKRLELAQAATREWLSSQHNIDVITIESCFGNMAAFVTVWFRRRIS